MPAMIVLGDKTDHGGEVIEASGVTDTHGKRIARVGDKVTCPKKGHGTNEIVTGDLTMVIDGKAVAYHGCKTACGAMLISGQSVTTVDFGGGSGAGTASASIAEAAADEPVQEFDEQIRAVDQATGQPLADLAYFVQTASGKKFSGRTDADGLCERISTVDAEDLQVWFGPEAESRSAA
jgi:uncharacterized Zn-binding protein involved in type VI secretion